MNDKEKHNIHNKIEMPEKPTYRDDVEDELDEALETAIEKSEETGNHYLVHVLSRELGVFRLQEIEIQEVA